MPDQLSVDNDPKEFAQDVFRAEVRAIIDRRDKVGMPTAVLRERLDKMEKASGRHPQRDQLGDASVQTPTEGNHRSQSGSSSTPSKIVSDFGLIGLAFSGGGIRSATFNLGILQGISGIISSIGGTSLLSYFDYLSTVSGGGYIGSWFSAWRYRTEYKKDDSEHKIFPGENKNGRRPPEINHLWLFSNYLSPRKGLLSAEFWRMVGFYVWGLLLNLAVLVPFLAMIGLIGSLLPVVVQESTWSWVVLTWVVGLVVGVVFEFRYLKIQYPGFHGPRLLASTAGLLLLVVISSLILREVWSRWGPNGARTASDLVTIWAPAVTFALAALLTILISALLWKWCKPSDEFLDEWPSRMTGRLIAMTAGWAAFFGIVLWGPWLMEGWWTKGIAGVAWVGSTGFGLLAKLPRESDGAATAKKWLMKLAPYLFLLGLLLGLVWSLDAIVKTWCGGSGDVCVVKTRFFLLGAATVLVLAFGYLMDINEWSLHVFYRDRLIRAYLGASNLNTKSDPKISEFTHKVKGDDIRLSELDPCQNGGPYPLLNCTLNLVGGQELWSQQRKADFFLLSPKFCGSEHTRYRPTKEYAGDTLTLGKALAISGAAVSPEQGAQTSAALAALYTLFNFRLGYWIANPRESFWTRNAPSFWAPYLFKELFFNTNDVTEFCYLSDGGHHENLGLYELVRRRCRYIICCDAGADPKMGFEDIGNAIRKIRADQGIDIEVDLDMLRPQAGQRFSRWHHAIGTVRYDQAEPTSPVGILVYIKASLTGDEPADVLEYAGHHETFPHESTAEQFFDEPQFESYRQLGEHIATEVFRRAQPKLEKDSSEFFCALQASWITVPPAIQDSFLQQTQEFMYLEADLQRDEDLARYDQQAYPELLTLLGEDPNRLERLDNRAVLHFCIRQLQLMENVFFAVRLSEYHAHPLNRGWMNLFRRWTTGRTLRLLWPSLKSIYSKPFVAFAEYQLNLSGIEPKIQRFPIKAPTSGTGPKEIKQVDPERGSLPPFLAELHRWREPDRSAPAPATPWERMFRELRQEWPLSGLDQYERYLRPFEQATDVWTISHPASDEELWGVALLAAHPEKPPLQRLLIWIRPSYRGIGLGSKLAESVMAQLRQSLDCLLVVLPPLSRDKPGYGMEMAGWLKFYDRYGFVRVKGDQVQELLQYPPGQPLDPEAFCLARTALRRQRLGQENATAPRNPQS